MNIFGHPEKMAISNSGIGFVKTINGIVKFDTKTNKIIDENFIKNYNAYGISIDDTKEKIYLTDPKNYISNGKVYIYNFSGNLTDSLTTGLIPSVIAFKK